MRGKLVHPFLVAFCRLDTAAIEAASGYDEDFHTTTTARPFGARGARQKSRQELAEVRIRCQVEVININRQAVGPAGNVPDYRTSFVCHYHDLERASLVDAATGKPLIRPSDRVDAIYTTRGVLVRKLVDPQVFVTESRDLAYGLGGRRNLLMLITDDRPQGVEETR